MTIQSMRAGQIRQMRGHASVSWLALLVAIGSAAWVYWYVAQPRNLAPVIEKPARTADTVETGQLQSRLARLEDRLPEISAALDEARESAEQLRLERDRIHSLNQQSEQDSERMALLDVEMLINQAAQAITGSTDFAAPIQLLTAARQRLARSRTDALEPLAVALDADRERLLGLSRRSVLLAADQLERLARDAGSLKLRGEPASTVPAPEPAGDAGSDQAGAGFWQRVVKSTEALVSVPEMASTPAGQRFFVTENLRLRLLGARLSLMLHDQAGFDADRLRSDALLRDWFDAADPDVIQARKTLADLSGLTAPADSANVRQSLEALEAVRAAQGAKAGGAGS